MDRRDHRQRTHFGRGPSRAEALRERLLQDWYGEEQGRLESVEHQRGAVRAGEVLAHVFKRFGIKVNLELADLQAAWTKVVGPDIARQTFPYAVHNGTVQIEVPDPTWRYVLETTRKKAILEAVRTHSKGQITGLRLVPAGRRPDESRNGPRPRSPGRR